MNVHRLLLIVLTAACATLATGCGAVRTSDQTVELPSTPLAVDVSNFRGGVTIRVEPSRRDASVRSSVYVEEGAPKEDIPAWLETLRVDATLVEQDGGAVLRVETSPAEGDWAHRVDLVVEVPRCDGVRVQTEGGHIVVLDADGAATLANRGGGIDFRTSHPVDEPLTLTAVDGSIFVGVPPGSRGMVDLQTLEGEVRFKDFGAGLEEAYSTVRTFTGVVNGGTAPIVCRTNDGDVWMRMHEDPIAYVPPLGVWYPRHPESSLLLGGSFRWTRDLPDDDLPEPIPVRYYDQ